MSKALFPFVLMQRDPKGRTPIATLSDGLQLALIYVTSEGNSQVMFREDLEERGVDPGAAYLDSRERLMRLVRARLVRMRAVRGPSSVPCLAFDHSFLAASCAVLPDLFDLAHRHLKIDSMLLAIPRRDLLVVAPNLGKGFRSDLRARLEVEEGRIFSLDPSGPSWLPAGKRQIGPANLSNDGMIPITVQSVDDAAVTRSEVVGVSLGRLRPYRQTNALVTRKRCA